MAIKIIGFTDEKDFISLSPDEVEDILGYFLKPGGSVYQYVAGDGTLQWIPAVPEPMWGEIGGSIGDQTDLSSALSNKVNVGGSFADAYTQSAASAPNGYNVNNQVEGQRTLANTVQHSGLPTAISGSQIYLVECHLVNDAGTTKNVYQIARSIAPSGDGYAAVFVRTGVISTAGTTWNDWAQLGGSGGGAGTVTSVGLSAPTGFNVSNSPITDAGDIALTYASGYQGYTTTEANKLAGIAAGAQVNVPTNLGIGTRTATSVPITSSTGNNATLPVATTTLAGALSAADKSKLNGISANATVGADWATNLTSIPTNISSWANISPGSKFDTPSGTTAQYIRGDGSLASFPSIPSGTVTSVSGGNGLSGSVTSSGSITLGTPSSITLSSTNGVTTSSHTHSFAPGGTTAQYIRGDGSLASFPSIPAGTVTSVTGGNGLSGSVTSSGSITLGTPGTLSGSTTNAVQTSSHTHALSTNLKAWDGYHPDDSFVYKGTIPGSVDLNTYRTTGIYHQNANADATSGTNYPANSAGMLTVFESSSMTYQTYQIYNTGDVYTRSRYNTSWSVWKLSVDGTTTISAGNGLSGGGSLASNRTITLGTPGTITGSTTNAVQTSSHTHALTLVAADIPNLAASQVTSGSFAAARIPNLNASKITAGTLPVARGGTGGTTRTGARTGIGIYVQSGDPGSSASDGDLWIW